MSALKYNKHSLPKHETMTFRKVRISRRSLTNTQYPRMLLLLLLFNGVTFKRAHCILIYYLFSYATLRISLERQHIQIWLIRKTLKEHHSYPKDSKIKLPMCQSSHCKPCWHIKSNSTFFTEKLTFTDIAFLFQSLFFLNISCKFQKF